MAMTMLVLIGCVLGMLVLIGLAAGLILILLAGRSDAVSSAREGWISGGSRGKGEG